MSLCLYTWCFYFNNQRTLCKAQLDNLNVDVFSPESVIDFGFRAFRVLDCGQSVETLITVSDLKVRLLNARLPCEANKLNISKLRI